MRSTFDINKNDVLIKEFSGNVATNSEPIRCNHLMIIVCSQGEMSIEVNYTSYTVRKDMLFIVNPFDIFTCKQCSDDFSCTVLATPPLALSNLIVDVDMSLYDSIKRRRMLHLRAEHLASFTQLTGYMKSVRALVPVDRFNQMAERMMTSFIILLDHLYAELGNTHGGSRECVSRKKELFGKFIHELIDSHSISREVLFYANELGVSCGYLNEICNEISNHSVKEIIDSAVTTRLKYELSYTSKSIQEIADEYNFPSQSYFYRYYKRMTGVTPSDFRKRRAEG